MDTLITAIDACNAATFSNVDQQTPGKRRGEELDAPAAMRARFAPPTTPPTPTTLPLVQTPPQSAQPPPAAATVLVEVPATHLHDVVRNAVAREVAREVAALRASLHAEFAQRQLEAERARNHLNRQIASQQAQRLAHELKPLIVQMVNFVRVFASTEQFSPPTAPPPQ
jgi:hypothetical protein